jgi:hypothetical protein
MLCKPHYTVAKIINCEEINRLRGFHADALQAALYRRKYRVFILNLKKYYYLTAGFFVFYDEFPEKWQ